MTDTTIVTIDRGANGWYCMWLCKPWTMGTSCALVKLLMCKVLEQYNPVNVRAYNRQRGKWLVLNVVMQTMDYEHRLCSCETTYVQST